MTTMTAEATDTGLARGSNYEMIKRLLGFMRPFNTIMLFSLVSRTIKFIGQAAVCS